MRGVPTKPVPILKVEKRTILERRAEAERSWEGVEKRLKEMAREIDV